MITHGATIRLEVMKLLHACERAKMGSLGIPRPECALLFHIVESGLPRTVAYVAKCMGFANWRSYPGWDGQTW
jgi:hypothetical protein